MKKEYEMKNLHCADCARVLSEALERLDGVESAKINFVTQKFVLETKPDKAYEEVFSAVKKAIADFSSKIVLEDLSQEKKGTKSHKFLISGLDCADCGVAIEDCLKSMSGVEWASLNFSAGKLFVETQEDVSVEDLLKTIHQTEPDVVVTLDDGSKIKEKKKLDIGKLLVFFGLALGLVTIFAPLNVVAYWTMLIVAVVLIGHQTYITALRLLRHKVVNENLLVTISVVGAIIVGEASEGLMVVGLYTIGKMLEALAVNRSRNSIKKLIELEPDYAVIVDGEDTKKVNPSEVEVGQIIRVVAGERVPVDGVILSGTASVDQKHITGESVPIVKTVGNEISSGSIVVDGVLEIKVSKVYAESTVSRIMTLIEEASDKKSKTETFISRFSKYYTLTIMALAVVVGCVVGIITKEVGEAVYRGLIFLVVSCPCAFAISVPLSYFSGIGNASRHGILIKGSAIIDASSKLKIVAFDKTGTLTKGEFEVEEVEALTQNFGMIDILKFACWGEQYSNHPIALAIMKCGQDIKLRQVESFSEVAGLGVSYTISGQKIYVGKINVEEQDSKTVVYVSVDDEPIGKITLSDTIKETSKEAISLLHDENVRTIMLSGDNKQVAKMVADELGIEEYYGEMQPDGKYQWLIGNRQQTDKCAFVGDGINDAPSLAVSDVGISMGIGGSTSCIEASDVVLTDDDPKRVVDLIEISKNTRKIVIENILFALIIKVIFLTLGSLGITGMLFAVFADVGVTILAVANSMRALFHRTKIDKKNKQKN